MADKLKILHVTTHDEECGIAKYQALFLKSMRSSNSVENTIFPYSPNKTKMMTPEQFAPVLSKFTDMMRQHDILHIQHEFSFYSGSELMQIVKETKRLGKKVIVTVHTSLDAGFPNHSLKEIRQLRTFLGKRRLSRLLTNVHIRPMQKADLILVHNQVAQSSLISRGVRGKNIKLIVLPVPVLKFDKSSTLITNKLRQKKTDIIYCTVGFLSANKGITDAVMALKTLPTRYKLAIIGGSHPSGANDEFIKQVKRLIKEQNLADRVLITGYIKDDDQLNALIRECNLCVYPYDKKYYAGVTSAALNNSLANYIPAVAYPVQSIKEINANSQAVLLTKSFDYHDLADMIRHIDLKKQSELAKAYAHTFSYDNQANSLVQIYQHL